MLRHCPKSFVGEGGYQIVNIVNKGDTSSRLHKIQDDEVRVIHYSKFQNNPVAILTVKPKLRLGRVENQGRPTTPLLVEAQATAA